MNSPPLYTIQHVRKDDTLYGPIHGAMVDYETLCGLSTSHKWWILTNAFNGTPTCKKCLKTPLVPSKETR
jgi:hypothetical protein